ncbi:hypothetical protein [Pseudobacteriovorax antillogorgiicola]|uniref:Uncharacterized protein n=1 Tax=Pseudobacteriovorax antillogorgiicola TaxID=1513793 RepID=A0A1Y6B9U8_9BACT|nr:hypothetical protein [Pseudobacteriovorax antillogorgiicola]TCS57480.1 hypothetical protein EDD56_103220 [Pseudobacteriovorax antillogorgiicola]SMF00553.1 hypothetical protein SAMN06296036_103113 [Pseudobacteriovorax antillogorgiicola]
MELQVLIKEGIDQWLSKKPKQRSIHSLAKKAGVKYSTLISVYNNVINPQIEKLVPVLLMVFGSHRTRQILATYQPSLLEVFTQVLGADRSNQDDGDDTLYELLEKTEYFVVYLLCITTGVSRENIARLYGKTHLKALKDLYDLNFVEYDNGRYLAKKSFVSFPSVRKIMSFVPHLVSMFDDDNIGKGGNAFMFAENISENDLQRIRDLMERYNRDLKKILDSSDASGELCWYGVNFTNYVNPNRIEDIDI